jgi:hypothetical protein
MAGSGELAWVLPPPREAPQPPPRGTEPIRVLAPDATVRRRRLGRRRPSKLRGGIGLLLVIPEILRHRRGQGHRSHRARRIVALVVLAALSPLIYSYISTMAQPSNSSFFARTVEWMRDHGGRWLVNDVEHAWYSLNAPSKGGPALKALPRVGQFPPPITHMPQHDLGVYRPPPIAPVIAPSLRGEGVWREAGPTVVGQPPVLVTTFRAERDYPRLVAGVAWINSSLTRVVLYPGRYNPPSASSRGPIEVPPGLRSQLVATFNSGFKQKDGNGGFFARGHLYSTLKTGQATLLVYRSGQVDIRAWGGGPRPPASIIYARQNLPPIINYGTLNPHLSDGPQWGYTLGNAIRVWRSGVGIDRRGNLIFAAADNQTVTSLARILRRAGAVRAMELDINHDWVSFITYAGWDAHRPANLLPNMSHAPTRYLSPDDRDFFAVYRRF